MNSSRLRRLRTVSTVLMIATIGFSLYWSLALLIPLGPFITTDAIFDSYYVEEGATVTFLMRFLYASLWAAVIIAGWVTTYYGAKLLWHVRQGRYFERTTAKVIKQFGVALALTMVADTFLGAFGFSILTWGNQPLDETVQGSVGYIGPSYYYDSGDITVFLCAFGFFLIGWVLQEGELIAAENRGFV